MAKRISQLAEITTVDSNDLLNIVDVSDTTYSASGTNKRVTKANLLKEYDIFSGWISAEETWTYVSTDDPTGVIKINANVTSKYSEGMRLKMTNGGNTIYAIITKMGTYGGDEAGYTYITFLHEIDPTDSKALHLMANSAITSSYYSTQKAPQGFPMSPDKWSVETTSSSVLSQNPATKDVWYNKLSIILPIGSWSLMYKITLEAYAEGATQVMGRSTLSTADNSESDSQLTASVGLTSVWIGVSVGREKFLSLSSKTTYYLNILNTGSGSPSLRVITINGAYSPSVIRATCAYL